MTEQQLAREENKSRYGGVQMMFAPTRDLRRI